MLNVETFKEYAKNNLNVLLTGEHGVGKTAMIKEIFNDVFGDMNKKWLYFSASTLDPWVDFVGVPDPYTNEQGKRVFRIIPPEHLTGDEGVEAMFFDELNRADDKTLNAVMELIQFKSINGRRFPNLKVIWAAQNPSDENKYSVGELDPAQMDRFQVQVVFPLELNSEYMTSKYGETVFACMRSFWEGRKKMISPRKLDDIISAHMMGFDISDFAMGVDLTELKNALGSVGDIQTMISVAKEGNADKIKRYFTLDKIRKNEVLLNVRQNKKQIFNNIYEFMPEEVKSYIKDTFNYMHVVSVSAESEINDKQIDFLNSFDNKFDFESGNVEVFFDKIKNVVEVFDHKQIIINQVLDSSDMERVIIKCEEDVDISDEFFLKLMSGEHTEEKIKVFHDYVRICFSVASETKNEELKLFIADFMSGVISNNSLGNMNFFIVKIYDHISKIKKGFRLSVTEIEDYFYKKVN